MEKGYEMFKNPIIEDNGTKKNCPNLGRNTELEKKSEKFKEIIASKKKEKSIIFHFQ